MILAVFEGAQRVAANRRLRDRDAAADTRALPDPDRPAGIDRIPEIRHIVILMMENHSFDNYLGLLGRGDGLSVGADGQPTNHNLTAAGRPVPSHHMASTVQVSGVPTQSWRASHIQYGDGANDGFVRSIEATLPGKDPTVSMGYWTPEDLPFYAGLASVFPLADRWFCSCLGPTFPNRRFLMAATANGLIDDVAIGMLDYPSTGTIFDLLDRHGISWANYHHTSSAKAVLKRLLGRSGLLAGRGARLALSSVFPSLLEAAQGNIQFTADLYPLGLLRCLGHLRSIDGFWRDAAEGNLPAVTLVDPDFQAGSEENPQDIHHGEGFAAEVVNAVTHGKGWPHTLLVWMYDEHGGYYDHVPPPAAPPPDNVGPRSLLDAGGPLRWLLQILGKRRSLQAIDLRGGAYDRLGFRIPAVVVSPYAKADHVSHTVYDHTSVLKLIEEKWNLPPLTARDAAATSPLDMVDLTKPTFMQPPELPAPAVRWSSQAVPVPAKVKVARAAGLVGRRVVSGGSGS